ncbi:glycoside hydrolase family 3 C-terminal domain-containing protein [Clostridium estertheticum]|uniref:glycoside hydrolase family 3 N-terminal domain-containing protein n=1 Tax=Clostridium estertheticum TaxID=238834 RepID=UPI001C0DFC2D|nr:glycoside hydrolase family 3 N-terminal domain-containing protein [Clostridium estertheticum]MBU3201329.1 glycoside hydrolase family 3 C-terminal domain-containing protein [Clostridium estertheticum]WAG66666.1 glycoside hydrolase family 3 C-terminal domain-containing protein [Clostridium estertheticum]
MNYIYQNPSLTPMERTLNLLSLMTLEEKVGQMMQISYSMVNPTEAEEWVSKKFSGSFLHVLGDNADHLQELALSTRLGIPLIFGIDAIHGHGLLNGATIFPSQLAMSCSFNTDLIEKAGRVTAKEVAADGLHWTFSPVLCIGRDMRWGRIDETFGEDPYLIGVLASAIIKGYQGENLSDPNSILACAKHYLAYGESTGAKDAYDTQVTVRKIREVFLPPFKKAVEVGCATFMTGYQSIDGTPMAVNKKMLKGILKDELGFEGFVVTDWNNTGSLVSNQKVSPDIFDASKKTIESGNDMIMNTNDFYDATLEQVKKGEISESLIDEAVKRILNIKFSMGLFDGKKRRGYVSKDVINCVEHQEANIQLTRESMVLLENKNNTLPLKNIKKIAVIGPNADDIQAQFGDWTFFSHPNPSPDAIPNFEYYTMLRGIQELASSKEVEVSYHKGCDIMNKEDIDIDGAINSCKDADVIIAVVGDCLALNGEFKDRATLDLSGSQQKLLEELKKLNKPLVVVLVNGKPLSIPWITQNADAVIETFNSGTLGGKALAQILFGEFNPCGKLTISFPYHSGQTPVYYNHLPGWHSPKYADMPVEDPLYSFGYGLSYTNYEYSNLKLSKAICSKEDTITVSVDVTNVGESDGTEIVQLYINDIVSSVMTPVKELKGFKRVFIKVGETETVNINLAISDLTIVNADEEYVVEPGEFEIMVGSDSRDQSLIKEIITVK